jgi:hypothetical protein
MSLGSIATPENPSQVDTSSASQTSGSWPPDRTSDPGEGEDPASGSSDSSGSSNKTIIIAVTSILGVIALSVAAYFGVRRLRRGTYIRVGQMQEIASRKWVNDSPPAAKRRQSVSRRRDTVPATMSWFSDDSV